MSTITLEMLTDAAIATLPDATPAEQGELVAALVKKFDAELAPKPARKAQARKASKPATMRMTKRGAMMPVAKGTATKGQIKRLADYGIDATKWSMADAADKYFDLKA